MKNKKNSAYPYPRLQRSFEQEVCYFNGLVILKEKNHINTKVQQLVLAAQGSESRRSTVVQLKVRIAELDTPTGAADAQWAGMMTAPQLIGGNAARTLRITHPSQARTRLPN